MKSVRILALFLVFGLVGGVSSWAGVCSDAIRQVEVQYGMPYQLLDAISATESGRYLNGKTEGWPWTLNVEGAGHYYDSKQEAIAAVEKFRKQGKKSIDIGCMQINLKHHPKAFSSLEEGFDPNANVRYSAQFLQELKARHNTWARAIAHYHSATPERQMIYKKRILAAWRKQRGEPAPSTPVASASAGVVRASPAYSPAMRAVYERVASAERARRYDIFNQRQQRGLKVIRFPQ
jgi:hypothetical protein